MRRVRLTVNANPSDRSDDLRYASQVRTALWAHSPAEVDPASPIHGTHRDDSGRAYFEFLTNYPDEVQRVLRDYGYEARVTLTVEEGEIGPPCDNCGNIAGAVLPTVCPTCSFRNISPCPYCNQEIARQGYLSVAGDLFKCPMCNNRVRLRFNDPLFNNAGYYNQPLVIVERATEPSE